jgi:hypothetical protein
VKRSSVAEPVETAGADGTDAADRHLEHIAQLRIAQRRIGQQYAEQGFAIRRQGFESTPECSALSALGQIVDQCKRTISARPVGALLG